MANLTLAVSKELREKMKKFPEINWSEVARKAIAEKTQILEKMDRIFSKSRLTAEEALQIGREINKRVWKRHKLSS